MVSQRKIHAYFGPRYEGAKVSSSELLGYEWKEEKGGKEPL